MSTLLRRLAGVTDTIAHLNAQIRELDRARYLIKKARLSARRARRKSRRKKNAERGARLDAPRFALRPQVQGRIAPVEEFGPSCEYGMRDQARHFFAFSPTLVLATTIFNGERALRLPAALWLGATGVSAPACASGWQLAVAEALISFAEGSARKSWPRKPWPRKPWQCRELFLPGSP